MKYRIIIVIFILFSMISTGMIMYTNNIQKNVIKNSGLDNAKIYADAITAFRTLYTSEVVSIAIKHGLEITHNYQNKKAIPLPATLSILLGHRIGKNGSGASTKLYSPYPFPWREKNGGLTDDFSKKAWGSLLKDSDKPYFEFSLHKNNNALRYAVADKMRTSCINCHNSHPDSPKTDWKEGDVRGILEVVIPLNNVITNTDEALNVTIFIYTLLSLLGITGIIFIIKKHKDESSILISTNNELTAALAEIKTLQGIIPICSYCHNIRDDKGAWDKVDAYISKHSEAEFSHGICPDCFKKARDEIKKN